MLGCSDAAMMQQSQCNLAVQLGGDITQAALRFTPRWSQCVRSTWCGWCREVALGAAVGWCLGYPWIMFSPKISEWKSWETQRTHS